ncbi:hypothetical protein E3P89_00302 [Wallemia ichthyophaga]|uniref:Cleft lip and palate transmembrane protein 1-like protein n=1 Tax=Wallemia ichthyophaga TaxID=245174 RepID=A0A4T0HP99_WALIC|nr:hypothetical protein E3P90_00461 [Wallemia ichthyophaga]TIB18020.1 hypothetical protein E3P93_00318 [Wallemia ichthyophaga]TIB25708.1 hypothetical protein E3P89_00302 [Wallemia ichthyophaga]TIB27209.1 hypothetical protein E3P88_00330 [Wallemia ichthyophaga]
MADENNHMDENNNNNSKLWHYIRRVLFIWFVSKSLSYFIGLGIGNGSVTNPPPITSPHSPLTPKHVTSLWDTHTNMDLYIKLSTLDHPDITSNDDDDESTLPHLLWENIHYGDWKLHREATLDLHLPPSVTHHNHSLYADFYLYKHGSLLNSSDSNFDPLSLVHSRKPLIRYLPKQKERKQVNLLEGDSEVDNTDDVINQSQQSIQPLYTPYYHPSLPLNMIQDTSMKIPYTSSPPPTRSYISLDPSNSYHYPILYPNDLWLLRNQLIEINSTTTCLPLTITLDSLTFFKFNLYANINDGIERSSQQQGTAGELDEFKRMILETNPYFLALTMLVTLLHTLFEFLAFKSDVSHWRDENHDMVGVSLNSILANIAVQLIILLYLLDNNDNASWTIIGGQGVGLVIEMWKVTKAVDVGVMRSENRWLPHIRWSDKKQLTAEEKKSREYDTLAFKYVSWVMIPILLAYTIYSLLYDTHRGWYSFVVSTLTSFVYAFGFVQLIPQLIINYKLKSVAHMPGRAMVYKTLSTVIDDLFSFIIKMPLLHRLSCFRDDVVFIIYLYQRWIYAVDPDRLNEYGQATDEKVNKVNGASKVESKKDQ